MIDSFQNLTKAWTYRFKKLGKYQDEHKEKTKRHITLGKLKTKNKKPNTEISKSEATSYRGKTTQKADFLSETTEGRRK